MNDDKPPVSPPGRADPPAPPLDYRPAEPRGKKLGVALQNIGFIIVGFPLGFWITMSAGAYVLNRFGTPPAPGAGVLEGYSLGGRARLWGIAGCAVVFVGALATLVHLFLSRRQSRFALLGLLLGIGFGSLLYGLCFGGSGG